MELKKGHGLGFRRSLTPPHRRRALEDVLAVDVGTPVERRLDLPRQYIPHYDQGIEGACVGFGYSWMMSILNRRKYAARWLYLEAQKVDPWQGEDYSGTSSEAGAQVLIDQGHRRIWWKWTRAPKLTEGIATVRWANPRNVVNELRACIRAGIPFGMGVDWLQNFDRPVWTKDRGWIIGEGDLGLSRGGHFICGYGATDHFELFHLVNSWGPDYPLVKIPYRTIERLAELGGEFAVITDR
jgi:hypothetical protein